MLVSLVIETKITKPLQCGSKLVSILDLLAKILQVVCELNVRTRSRREIIIGVLSGRPEIISSLLSIRQCLSSILELLINRLILGSELAKLRILVIQIYPKSLPRLRSRFVLLGSLCQSLSVLLNFLGLLGCELAFLLSNFSELIETVLRLSDLLLRVGHCVLKHIAHSPICFLDLSSRATKTLCETLTNELTELCELPRRRMNPQCLLCCIKRGRHHAISSRDDTTDTITDTTCQTGDNIATNTCEITYRIDESILHRFDQVINSVIDFARVLIDRISHTVDKINDHLHTGIDDLRYVLPDSIKEIRNDKSRLLCSLRNVVCDTLKDTVDHVKTRIDELRNVLL